MQPPEAGVVVVAGGVVVPESALQDTLALMPLPVQVQFHGPEPDTAEAVPVEHRLAVGAVVATPPFAEPQMPLTVRGTHVKFGLTKSSPNPVPQVGKLSKFTAPVRPLRQR